MPETAAKEALLGVVTSYNLSTNTWTETIGSVGNPGIAASGTTVGLGGSGSVLQVSL
jgi:hypothetical protein